MGEPTSGGIILGMMFGAIITLLIQAYGRRKVRKAIARTPETERTIELLIQESDRHIARIDHLQERTAVLERIATDPAHRTARAIDALT
ncbi:MAG: hypothetical protein ACKVOJ_06710 [Sphingomonadaceae bacterium]